MKDVQVISAAEAKKAVLDMQKEAKILAEEALIQVYENLDQKVRTAIKFGEWQATIDLSPISRLIDINVEASKLSVVLLSNKLKDLNYKFDFFTNHSNIMIVRW